MTNGDDAIAAGPVEANAYDEVAYISAVMPRIDVERLGVIARLHGLDPAPPASARVLEVGGGDGLNLSAFAAAFPDSRCLSFDLAGMPVIRGQELARAAGIDNVRIERLDILDAAQTLAGPFDYVIVHGVYAWVPAPVREAIFRLIGRVLSPNGLAMVSYNALPGQQLSLALRTMIGSILEGFPSGMDRAARAAALLREYAEGASDEDNPFAAAMRKRAKALADRPHALLAHDEFGSCFEPQSFVSTCAAAGAEGLAYLNDAAYLGWEQGFPGAEVDEPMLRRSIDIHDHRTGCLFRHSLFVREGQPIRRSFDPATMRGLRLASSAQPEGSGKFAMNNDRFEVADQRLDVILREAARRYPETLPLEGLSEDRLTVLARLFLGRGIMLTTGPIPAGLTPVGDPAARPRVSPFARAQAARGDAEIGGYDRVATQLSDDFRYLLLKLDGSRDAAALAAEVGFGEAEAVTFIGMVSQRALLMP